ncbi:unnamed protein product [Urochloa decumbens]|uniref:Zinc finger LSD1-type domain-containing protein n=1 Tax=Urochloa decumbens TaxID=240449 RepID=A0ABC9DPR4_9POAL
MDTELENGKHEVVSNGSNAGVTVVNTNSKVSHGYLPSSVNKTKQGTNIISDDINSMSAHIGDETSGTSTMVYPSGSIDLNNTYYEDDSSAVSDYNEGIKATKTEYEESSDNSINALSVVLSSKLHSCYRKINGMSNTSAIANVTTKDNTLVVAGCQMCMLYIMIPAGTNVCFRCGNPTLIHFGGNGQA